MVESDSEFDNLITQIGNININDFENTSNFIDLKTNIKEEINQNPHVTYNDRPGGSRGNTGWDKSVKGYAGLSSTMKNTDKHTPFETMKSEPINPFGIYLDLDCINNIEEAIDKWETATRIAVTVNKMDFATVQHFIERSLVNSAIRFWQNLAPDARATIYGTDNSVPNLITRATEAIRLEFAGEGNFTKDPGTIKKYKIALLRLQLCDICEIDKYICVFQDYYYHIYNQIDMTGYLELFYTKIPDPWGKKLIDTYNPETADTLGKRITHLKDKFSEWCGDAILAKLTKGLRKRVSLCCDNVKMPIMIGCDSSHYYNKIKRRYKKKKYFKRRYFKKRKARYYKKKGYKKPNKSFYKRKRINNPKECRCYYCNEIGHYANKCPKKFDKNKKKIEIDNEIDSMIEQGDFIQINAFEEIDTDESIFILTDTEYESSTEDE